MRAALGFAFCGATIASARHGEAPYSLGIDARDLRAIAIEEVGAIDARQRRIESDARIASGFAPTKRLATADHVDGSLDSARGGTWQLLADGSRLWRARVRVRGATDLRFAFDRFDLPRGATLYVIGADDYYQGPYIGTDAHAGAFHSAVVPGDTATIELRVPAGADASAGVDVASVGAGFRDLFKRALDTGPGSSGACNVNVVCPLGAPYGDEIRAVAYYEFTDDSSGDTFICSGTLMADVPQDRRNYFLTAAHCITSVAEAASMVVYWNYQSTICQGLSAPPDGFFGDDQHGATLRARRADADFSLVELDTTPEADWDVYYAGWDASGATPSGTIGLHHPSGDVKKITEGPAPETVDNCIGTGGGSHDTHWETGPYIYGTTEGGSSGSGLFFLDPDGGRHDRLLIGTLSGGDAACSATAPTHPNNGVDCYGKLAAGWNGSSATSRLRDWLDPANTGALLGAGVDSANATAPSSFGHSQHQRPTAVR